MIAAQHTTGNLREAFRKILMHPLPGTEAQMKMVPAARAKDIFRHTSMHPLRSSVLILIYYKGTSLHTLFIRRPEYPGIHSGQMAFPGGRFEPADQDDQATALRETEEEIGIERSKLWVAGALTPLYIPPSNYMVYPFIAFTDDNPVFDPDPSEVAGIVEIPIKSLLDPGTIRQLPPSPEFRFLEVPAYVIGDAVIWGATAMITAEFIAVIHSHNLERLF